MSAWTMAGRTGPQGNTAVTTYGPAPLDGPWKSVAVRTHELTHLCLLVFHETAGRTAGG